MTTYVIETMEEAGKNHLERVTNSWDTEYFALTAEVSRIAEELVNEKDSEVVSLCVDFPVFKRYLYAIDERIRQYHNCRTCGRFFENYAGLAVIVRKDTFFTLIPLLVDEVFKGTDEHEAMQNLVQTLRKTKVDSVFKTEENMLGTPVTRNGEVWNHLYFDTRNWASKVRYSSLKKSEIAESKEAYKVIRRGYSEIKSAIPTAVSIRSSLYRSEEITHMLSVLEDLHHCLTCTKNEREKELIFWWFVSRYPSVCLHFRASVLYTFLYDIQGTRNLEACVDAFNKKMDPTKYKRVQAEATTDQISVAFDKITEMGYTENDFKRAFFSREEIKNIPAAGVMWSSYQRGVPKRNETTNFFADTLIGTPKDDSPSGALIMKKGSMRFFLDDILDATDIWYVPKSVNPFFGTLVGPSDGKNIHKYQSRVAHYCYTSGLASTVMNLPMTGHAKVLQITTLPEMWSEKLTESSSSMILFFIDGVYDKNLRNAGGTAIFPENLNKELFPYRHVIENFSKKDSIANAQNIAEQAGGVALSKQYLENNPMIFIVRKNGIKFSYTLTSWE